MLETSVSVSLGALLIVTDCCLLSERVVLLRLLVLFFFMSLITVLAMALYFLDCDDGMAL